MPIIVPTPEEKDECIICHKELPSGNHLCRNCENNLEIESLEIEFTTEEEEEENNEC